MAVTYKTIFLAFLVIALVVGGVWYAGSKIGVFAPTAAIPTDDAQKQSLAQEFNAVPLTEKYQNAQYGFSFNYPKGFEMNSFNEDVEGDTVTTVLAQDPSKTIGFQIYVSPFDDSDPNITPERIKQDIPDIQVTDQQEVRLGNSSKGLAFMSAESNGGTPHREVWFVFNKNLYQITASVAADKILQSVLNTWKFDLNTHQ
jgi:hypothetical protein